MNAIRVFLLVLIAAIIAGCSDDAVKPDTRDAGTVQGEIRDSDFEFTIRNAGQPGRPFEGPFVLRGTNLHYDESLQALVVDVTVRNHGVVPYTEPIGLTFVKLLPAGTTLLNPDNGINGDGAAIQFGFANDDGVWTPGETSFPRTLHFGVASGVAVGFVARLDIGEPIDGGTIGGLVWHDANKDGVIDPDEGGIPGVELVLHSMDDDSTLTRQNQYAVTGPDGRYHFSGLTAGIYVVSKALATPWYFPTTPSRIHVLLTGSGNDVTDFLEANFGCVPQDVPPPIDVGTYVQVEGKLARDPFRLVEARLTQQECGEDGSGDGGFRGAIDDTTVAPDCPEGILRGPVTGIARDERAFQIMGAWVVVDASVPPIEIHIGDRLDVRVHRAGNVAAWIADDIQPWEGEHEEVWGRVERAELVPGGALRLIVTDVLVIVSGPTWPRASR